MGYEENTLWARYRDQFPVTGRLIYLNHAAVAPLAKPAADAMRWLADDACEYGSAHYSQWLETYQGLRESAARLVGAEPAEIAVVKNTSEGIATVSLGLDWKPGDRMVAFQEEFPANYYPWARLEARGVEVRWLSITDPLERIEDACRGARLLAVSHVNYLSGLRMDLEAIGGICHRHGCLFIVDAIQGLGAFPVDVRRARIHALSADGHKWLMGPEGCGILYVQHDIQDRIEPVEFGWTNVAGFADYSSRDMTLRSDAGRYECGTLNTIGCFGLRAAIKFLLQVGIEPISQAVLALGDRLAAALAAKGYEILGGRPPGASSGIVTFRKEGVEARLLVSLLREHGIVTAPRQGWVRASPHFYISPEEVDQVAEFAP